MQERVIFIAHQTASRDLTVERQDDAVERLAEDRVVGILDNGGKPCLGFERFISGRLANYIFALFCLAPRRK
jgi:hypothetical protein